MCNGGGEGGGLSRTLLYEKMRCETYLVPDGWLGSYMKHATHTTTSIRRCSELHPRASQRPSLRNREMKSPLESSLVFYKIEY